MKLKPGLTLPLEDWELLNETEQMLDGGIVRCGHVTNLHPHVVDETGVCTFCKGTGWLADNGTDWIPYKPLSDRHEP